MILGEKITEERKKNGWSQEELADKLNVSRQAVSKWEGSQSVPDLQRVVQMAKLFGVSTDYLLNDELEKEPAAASSTPNGSDKPSEPGLRVTMEEANEYLSFIKENTQKVALGVMLCITSPAVLIVLVGVSEKEGTKLPEAVAALLGILVLFGMIAYAVSLFIRFSTASKRFAYLEQEDFETAYGVTGLAKEMKKNQEETFTRGLTIGIVLCILSPLPLIVAALLEAGDLLCCLFTSLLLIIISCGVYTIISVSLPRDSYDTLLEEGDYTRSKKKLNRKVTPIGSIYWMFITAIYLGISFITNRWDKTWIIWPAAGIAFAAVKAICGLTIKTED